MLSSIIDNFFNFFNVIPEDDFPIVYPYPTYAEILALRELQKAKDNNVQQSTNSKKNDVDQYIYHQETICMDPKENVKQCIYFLENINVTPCTYPDESIHDNVESIIESEESSHISCTYPEESIHVNVESYIHPKENIHINVEPYMHSKIKILIKFYAKRTPCNTIFNLRKYWCF